MGTVNRLKYYFNPHLLKTPSHDCIKKCLLCFCVAQACVLQRQRKGSVSSDASASTDSNTYYEDDFSSTEEDSSQGNHAAEFTSTQKLKIGLGRVDTVSL